MEKKTGLGPNSGMMIGRDMMTDIGQTEIDAMIIREMIVMMITDAMMIAEMIIVGIIATVIIHQLTTRGHTRVTSVMIIKEGMMIIDDTTMIEGMIIEDPRDLIRRFDIIPNPKMFDRHSMERGEASGPMVPNFYTCDKMVTMQISVQIKTKEKHRQ